MPLVKTTDISHWVKITSENVIGRIHCTSLIAQMKLGKPCLSVCVTMLCRGTVSLLLTFSS